MGDEQDGVTSRFVRFRRGRRLHHSSQVGAAPKPLRYGWFKRFIDRRNASRDGLSECPKYSAQPEPTPYIKGLIGKCVTQNALERERMDREIAPFQQALAELPVPIQAAQHTTNNALSDPAVEEWRQQDYQETKEWLEAAIANRNKQLLDRQNQLAAHTWVRIETYWGRLVQVHPDGEWMNEWINEWMPSQLVSLMQRLIELDELYRND